MPIYEYACEQGHRFEIRQGFHDEPLKACTECGQPARRLIQPAPIIFKGSGWYVTDSRSSGGTAKSESSGETKTETKTETKAETTSESKSESKSDTPSASKSETKTAAAAE